MNISLKLDDAGWTQWMGQLRNALSGKESILKKALLIVWPRDVANHFDQEVGWDGKWAPWADSTRQSRIAHELSVLNGKRSPGRTSPGGKILHVSGRLRTETVQEPILTSFLGGLKVESPTPYSGYLDEGTERMPARPFMWLGDDAQETMSQIFLDQWTGEKGGLI